MMQSPKMSPRLQNYAITVHENLDENLATWFGPLTVEHAQDGPTTLTVTVRDQTELHGHLIKIRDLNLTIISIVNI